jgi:hypothetical protein
MKMSDLLYLYLVRCFKIVEDVKNIQEQDGKSNSCKKRETDSDP